MTGLCNNRFLLIVKAVKQVRQVNYEKTHEEIRYEQ